MIRKFFSQAWNATKLPTLAKDKSAFWVGATWSVLLFVLFVSGVAGFYSRYSLPPVLMLLIGIVVGGLVYYDSVLLSWIIFKVSKIIPSYTLFPIGGAIGALLIFRVVRFSWPSAIYQPAVILYLLVSIVLGGSLALLSEGTVLPLRKKRAAILGCCFSVLLILWGLFWVSQKGNDPYPITFDSTTEVKTLDEEGINNPALPGPYGFEYFTYGSGKDKKRKDYAKAVKYQTDSVDARKLLPDWKEKKKKWRERYWGFGVDAFPLNGRVWMPEGEGPFPLILIVHGNHSMEDYSDGGYAYLGELLASYGFIAVSVDENFLNGTWSGDFMGKEMPTRAWLLLKHLEQWDIWSRDANHPLYQRANLDQVMLIGHSRGGEAVSIAAAFNQLPFFPDNAQEAFNFRFGIKGVVAIAPTDYRYKRQMKLENINFLSLQGSYDADEASFFGFRQYQRVAFTDTTNYWFKAGVYIHGANHGQFNTTWDRTDFGAPMNWLLNTAPIIPRTDQEQAAKLFISAFASMVFDTQMIYRPLFQQTALAGDWLADGVYLSNFKDSKSNIIANFEQDIDLAKEPKGVFIKAKNLSIWQEEQLLYRNKDTQGNNALLLGWDDGDSLELDAVATYEISFPDSLGRASDQLLLSIAAGDPGLLKNKRKGTKKDPPMDFSVYLIDSSGHEARLLLSEIKQVAPRLKVKYTKLQSIDKDMMGNAWEITLETFTLPFNAFDKAPAFDIKSLCTVRFVFDQTDYGVLVLDEIGFHTSSSTGGRTLD